jgi:hypothetical protein
MTVIFNGTVDQSLRNLRQKRLIEKTAKATSFVRPEKLPPTVSATKYHSLRSYLQIMKWKQYNSIDARKWGWTEKEGEFVPVLTDSAPAPLSILKVIRCQCHGDCSSRKRSCRKNNMSCTYACGQCQEKNCSNQENVMIDNCDDFQEGINSSLTDDFSET